MDNSRKIELLEQARSLVATGWTQDALQRIYLDGRPTEYCVRGAIMRCGRNDEWLDAEDALRERLAEESGGVPLMRWNDSPDRTQEEVVALYDRTIRGLSNG